MFLSVYLFRAALCMLIFGLKKDALFDYCTLTRVDPLGGSVADSSLVATNHKHASFGHHDAEQNGIRYNDTVESINKIVPKK